MILSPSDLAELTRRERPAAQARVLRRLGIPFKIHPSDGVLLVARDAAAAALWREPAGRTAEAATYDVDVDAIKSMHGKTANSY